MSEEAEREEFPDPQVDKQPVSTQKKPRASDAHVGYDAGLGVSHFDRIAGTKTQPIIRGGW
jgi:hypothetical protein